MRKKIVFLFIIFIWSTACAQKQVVDLKFPSIQSSESDSVRTLKSVQKVDNLYMMTFYGDYDQLLDEVNRKIINNGFDSARTLEGSKFECSIFAALGAAPLYGRNFDNPDCGVLITIYHPSDGYASIGFSRMNDFGFDKDEDPTSLPVEKRRLLLNAPFFTPDGMNECGLSVALAALRAVDINVDKNKKSIFITRLVREILDHARDVDESVAIIKKYNVFDEGTNKVSHHLLIADPSGRSVIVEYFNEEWRVMPNKKPWQAITNSPLYKISEESREKTCWRYKILKAKLKHKNGIITWEEGMDILKSVSGRGTQWSTIYDMKKREIYISIYKDFYHIKKIKIKM